MTAGRSWLRAFLVWLVIVAAETVHGIGRVLLLEPFVGDLRARQIGVFTGSVVILVIAWLFVPWLRPASTREAFRIGLLWVVLTIGFEVGLGRLVLQLPWDRILSDYDLSRGGLLPFGLIVLWCSPIIGVRARRRRTGRISG